MAQTELHKYTVAEKLNKMDVDLIDVAVDTNANADGEVLVAVTEIPNAVSVNGGTAILQSAVWIDNKALTGVVDVYITTDSTGVGDITNTISGLTNATSVLDGICGFFQINNSIDLGSATVGSKQNIGMVCKAASTTTSLYVFMVSRHTGDYDTDTGVLRLGFVKD